MKAHRLGWLLLVAACGRGDVIQGETDAVHVSVAAKVSGRVDSMYVREGDMVRHGQVVATLDGPGIRAPPRPSQAPPHPAPPPGANAPDAAPQQINPPSR